MKLEGFDKYFRHYVLITKLSIYTYIYYNELYVPSPILSIIS